MDRYEKSNIELSALRGTVRQHPTLGGRSRNHKEEYEMNRTDELLIKVVERYMHHRDYKTDNPIVAEMARSMCEIEVDEMWMLTQR